MKKSLYERLKKVIRDINQENSMEKSKELSELMCSKKAKKDIDNFLTLKSDNYKNYLDEVSTLLTAANIIFNYSGYDTGMSDSEYDVIYEKYNKNVDHVPITPTITANKNKVYHKYTSLRGTLDKVYGLTEDDKIDNNSQERLDDWIRRSEQRIFENTGRRVNLNSAEIAVFPKFDGVSCVFEFNEDGSLDRALTRGCTETNEAKDITHIFKGKVTGPYKKQPYPYARKTEIMISDDDFKRCNAEYGTNYKQSRSLVSSIINSDVLDGREKYLRVVPLRWSYFKDGVESPQKLDPAVYDTPYRLCRLKDREMIREFAEQVRHVDGMRTDGVVIYLLNKGYQEALGREDNRQKFEVAYKFTEEIGYSEVRGVHFTTGLFGTLTPIVDINPIVLKGNTITGPSIGNYSRFKELSLAKGDVVKIIYDIVPYLTFDDSDPNCVRSNNILIDPPMYCSDCGSILEEKLKESGIVDLVCKNPECPAKEKGRILNYLTKLGIGGIGVSTIELLYGKGYLKSISDLYKLEKHKKKILKLKGMGARTFDYLTTMLDVKRDIFASDFLAAIGIKGISKATFRQILSHLSYEEFMDLCTGNKEDAESTLCNMKGIRIKTATKVIEGINKNIDLIQFLEDELFIHNDPSSSSKSFKVCFTKIRSQAMESFIEENGGVVSDTLTKDCDLLIIPDRGVSSAKVKLAIKRDIPIVTIDEAKDYILKNVLSA